MKKMLSIMALLIAVPAVHAQTSSADPSQPRTRADVKAEERKEGSLGTKQNEYSDPASTKKSGLTRREAKAQQRSSGASGSGQDEYSDPASTKKSGLTRGEVKARERKEGSLGTKQDEYSTPSRPSK